MRLPLEGHAGERDDGNREDDEHEIRNDVGDAHGHELSVTLSTMWSWVGYYLPVVGEGPTFGEGGDDDADEGEKEVPADDLEGDLVGSFPDSCVDSLEELGDCELCCPDARELTLG